MFSILVLTLSASVPHPAVAQKDIERKLPTWLQTSGVASAAVAYIHEGQVAWTTVRGEASPEIRATNETLYNVASLTKPLVAETIVRLAAMGRLDLDEPMHRYWTDPDIASDPRHLQLTPRFALSHRTGFPNWRQQTKTGKLSFKGEPGQSVGYSGEGYEYVARFAEKKLQIGFEQLLQDRVLKPLGLARTAITPQAWFDDAIRAHGYDKQGRARPADVNAQFSAADNAYTQIADYAAFTAAVLRNEGLTPSIARQRLKTERPAFEPGRCPWAKEDCPKKVGFALGWAVFDFGSERVVLQGGADWGERALAFFVPKRKIGVVILTNSARGGAVIHRVVETLYDNVAFHRFLA
ncbi:MAG: serine hydrolase domain-containing protein, partial [Myxococcota bacterium]